MTAHWGYRLLVRAYPAGPRRDEVLDTLLAVGRRTPSWREAGNLLRHGLRARLGRPASGAVVAVALLVALTTGFFAAALSTRAAWEAVPDYPSGTRLAEITTTVFPSLPIEGGRDEGRVFRDPTGDHQWLEPFNEDFAYAGYSFGPSGTYLPGDYRTWFGQARQRLVDAGWTVREEYPTGATDIASGLLEPSGRALVAERGPLSLHLETTVDVVDTPAGEFYALASLNRWQPGWVTAVGVVFWLLGGLTGWLVLGWASRRTEAAGGMPRFLSASATITALVFLTPLTLLGMVGFVAETWRFDRPGQPFWAWSMVWGYGCTALGVLLLITALIIAVAGGRARHEERIGPDPRFHRPGPI
ncbi:hypothetical protein AB0C07_14575 [Actinoplanes missouriensis]|uniref:hypothetical protein n=1 Tax=Actinoplanes missouriensis TaxID=1866 RepID=UPI00341038D3